MHAVGLPVPAVLQYHEWKGREYLLLTAVPGVDASVPRPPAQYDAMVTALASGLRALHATNISACPFDQSRRARIAAAEARVRAGIVREDDFDSEREGQSAAQVYAQLATSPPASEDRVFTHGDYCLPNVLLTDDAGGFKISGFVDCGNAGIADPYQDLALCARSVARNFGPRARAGTVRALWTGSGGRVEARVLQAARRVLLRPRFLHPGLVARRTIDRRNLPAGHPQVHRHLPAMMDRVVQHQRAQKKLRHVAERLRPGHERHELVHVLVTQCAQ